MRGRVVTPLRRVPDKLAHECCRFGLHGAQLTPHTPVCSVRRQEADLAEVLPGVGQERRRGFADIPLVKLVYLMTQVRNGYQIGAVWMFEREVKALFDLELRQAAFTEQLTKFIKRHLERSGQLRAYPRLRLRLTALPAAHGGAVDIQSSGKLLLAEAHRLAPHSELLPLDRHPDLLPFRHCRRLLRHVSGLVRHFCGSFAGLLLWLLTLTRGCVQITALAGLPATRPGRGT